MPDPGNTARNGGSGAPATARSWDRAVFQSLPLTLSARLAAGSVRIGQLRAIGAGSVIPLETPVGEPSRLVAEGVVVASGEIVEIQGQLALRLTRLGQDDE